jgi:hypothetical protein
MCVTVVGKKQLAWRVTKYRRERPFDHAEHVRLVFCHFECVGESTLEHLGARPHFDPIEGNVQGDAHFANLVGRLDIDASCQVSSRDLFKDLRRAMQAGSDRACDDRSNRCGERERGDDQGHDQKSIS